MAANSRQSSHLQPAPPTHRTLQVFAFDPSFDLDLDTARINRSTLEVRWEENLSPGPVGEYLEVVDIDPASQCVYDPVDLDHRHILATRGLSPSEGNPQFHQQMVYAVAMKTIANFEQALGRPVQWSGRPQPALPQRQPSDEPYVPRLRIYPHALREANAYYSPDKKALLFGYFSAQNADARDGLPGGAIFTCLSHDVIAHEMTHAILDGVHRRLIEPSNEDSLAFHEAFADLIAIFQHFTLPLVLEHAIARTRGDLATENLLAKLASQFGRATRHGNALRDALGRVDPQTGVWRRIKADPSHLDRTTQPHARGAILVAALFDAFLVIYQSHTADLLRIASGGTGVLPDGALHPDLVARLADEASTVAQRLLTIIIRALDYLPPVDVTFGDYLRALITSDVDLVPDDRRGYRLAIVRAFRDRGIYPRDVRTLSVDTLRWSPAENLSPPARALFERLLPPPAGLRLMAFAEGFSPAADDLLQRWSGDPSLSVQEVTEQLVRIYSQLPPDEPTPGTTAADNPRRKRLWQREQQFIQYVYGVLTRRASDLAASDSDVPSKVYDLLGIDLFGDLADQYKFEINAVRPTLRIRGHGHTTCELLVLMTQRSIERLPVDDDGIGGSLGYRFRAGCTLLIDPTSGQVRYAIVKRLRSAARKQRQEEFLSRQLLREGRSARARYGIWNVREQDADQRVPQEPFRLMHRGCAEDQWS
ncbi:MAG: hypothetical protein WD872_19780 [Pirellulaceae bacterium]